MLTGVDIHFVLKELNIAGSRVQKIYSKGDVVYFVFYSEGVEKILKIIPGDSIYLSGKEEYDEYPSNFCMTLRKHLMNSRVKGVRQRGVERIVEIVFTKEREFILVLEFIKPGNIILCDSEYVIIFPQKVRKHSSRYIRAKEKYIPPSEKKGFESLKNSDKESIVKALAVDLGYGGDYSEEILARAGVAKDMKPNLITDEHLRKISESAKKMLSEKISASVSDRPYPIKMTTKPKGKGYDSFSLAIKDFLSAKKDEVIDESSRIREKMLESIREFSKKAKEYREKAEYILNNFDEIETLMNGIKRAADEHGWYRVKEMIDDYSGYETRMIENYSADEKKLTLKGEVEIDLTKSLGQNLNEYYELAKKYESKEKAGMHKSEEFSSQKVQVKRKMVKAERNWYDRFHWFVSSSGYLVVSGRNAEQNEELIKKYMVQEDLVMHADIHGSPFTLIKRGKSTDEKTLSEAAQFTAVHSSAWENNVSADVYCVSPHQVRESPPSGQYMPKGSFMIYGKKKFFKGNKMEIAVGFSERVISGPANSVRKTTKYYVILYPGGESRESTAKAIKRFLEKGTDYKIPIDDIVKVLPGDCRFWRDV